MGNKNAMEKSVMSMHHPSMVVSSWVLVYSGWDLDMVSKGYMEWVRGCKMVHDGLERLGVKIVCTHWHSYYTTFGFWAFN